MKVSDYAPCVDVNSKTVSFIESLGVKLAHESITHSTVASAPIAAWSRGVQIEVGKQIVICMGIDSVLWVLIGMYS